MFLQTKNARSLCCMTSKNTLTDWWFQLFQTVFVIGDHYPKHADLKTSHQSPAHRNSISPAPAISMVMFHHAKVDMKRKQNQACNQDLQKGDFTNKRWISPYLPNKHGQFHRENHGEPSICIKKTWTSTTWPDSSSTSWSWSWSWSWSH